MKRSFISQLTLVVFIIFCLMALQANGNPKLRFQGSTVNPGVMFGVSESFLNDLLIDEIPNIETIIKNLTFSEINIHKSLLDISFTNVTISSFQLDQSPLLEDIKLNEKTNSIALRLVIKNMRLNFKYKSRLTKILPSSGVGYIELIGSELFYELSPIEKEGQLQYETISANFHEGLIHLNLGKGVIKRFYSALIKDSFEYLWLIGQKTILQKVIDLVQQYSDKIPKFVVVKDDVNLDLTIVDTPLIKENFFVLKMNGAAYLNTSKPVILNPNVNYEVDFQDKDSQFFLHEEVVNDFLKVFFESQGTFSKDLVTKEGPGATADLDSMTFSPIFPQMQAYPPSGLTITIQNEGSPVVKVSSGNLFGKINATAAVFVNEKQLNGTVIKLPYANGLNFTGGANVALINQYFSITADAIDFEVTNMAVKQEDLISQKVDLEKIQESLQSLLLFGVSYLNGGVFYRNPFSIQQILKIIPLDLEVDLEQGYLYLGVNF